jgi:hypothetical protein
MENVVCNKARSFVNLNLFGEQQYNGLSSKVNNVTVKSITCTCDVFYDVTIAEGRTSASDFTLEDLTVTCRESRFRKDLIENTKVKNVRINGAPQ